MVAEIKHKDPKYNARFTSTLWKNEDDYGNGTYMDIRRNGNEFKYIDCRYMINFNEKETLMTVLKEHYGDNLLEINFIEE